jgi:hypothetical protein
LGSPKLSGEKLIEFEKGVRVVEHGRRDCIELQEQLLTKPLAHEEML